MFRSMKKELHVCYTRVACLLTYSFLFVHSINVFWKPYLWQVIFLSIGNRVVNKLLQKKICRKKNPRPHGASMQMNDIFPARSDFTQYFDDLLLSFCWIWIWARSSCHNFTATRATLEKTCKEWLHLIGPSGRWCLGPSSRVFCRAHVLPCSSMLESFRGATSVVIQARLRLGRLICLILDQEPDCLRM